MLRLAAGHGRVDGDLLDGGQAEGGFQDGDYFLRVSTRCLQHPFHKLGRRRHQGQAVAPLILQEQAVHPVEGVQQVVALDVDGLRLGHQFLNDGAGLDGLGEAGDEFFHAGIHHRVDVGRGLVRDDPRDHHHGQRRQAIGRGAPAPGFFKAAGNYAYGRHPALLH